MASNPVFAILWMLLLFFIAWPVAWFCAGLWIFLQPFESCFEFIKQIDGFLEKIITWPRECGKAIMTCQQEFPAPF
jgi:hypothetical protein